MSKTSEIPIEIQELIIDGICNADDWFGCRIACAKKNVEDHGYEWFESYEDYVFNYGQEEQTSNKIQTTQLNTPAVIGSSILAEIEHINDLGKSKWYEVVYYDDGWYSYAGSKTFQDGEKVIRWRYAKDCL